MSDLDKPATDALLQRMAADSAARIQAADAKAHEANTAFVAGRFGEYFDRQYQQTQEAIQDEYEQIVGQNADSGNGETSG